MNMLRCSLSGQCSEDITAPMDVIETDDLGYLETDMTEAEWQEPLQSLRARE